MGEEIASRSSPTGKSALAPERPRNNTQHKREGQKPRQKPSSGKDQTRHIDRYRRFISRHSCARHIAIADFQLEAVMQQCDSYSVRLATGFAEQDLIRKAIGLLAEPKVILQARKGATGASQVGIDMVGSVPSYGVKQSQVALDFDSYVGVDSENETYFQGGFIPPDKVFIVDRIEYRGTVANMEPARSIGRLTIHVGGTPVVNFIATREKEVHAVWQGNVVVRPGMESTVLVMMSDPGALQAEISGRFEPLKDHPSKR